MASKMQLDTVGKMCPGYNAREESSPTFQDIDFDISCNTCVHWKKGLCEIDLFDEVLSSLDQT